MAVAKKTVPRRANGRDRGAQDATRNRRVRPRSKPMTGLWIILMALFFVEALFYAWCRVQCVNAGYGIDRETGRHQALLKERNTLKIELARLNSPARIETIARTRLGLVMSDAQQTVTIP
jgi:cell division protein FtsL